MNTKEFLFFKLNTILSEQDNTTNKITMFQDNDKEYRLIYEHVTQFNDLIKNPNDKPFLIYEHDDNLYGVVVNPADGVINIIDVIIEKEEHDQYNAVGVNIDAIIMGINQNNPIPGKIDTGAECCSLGVEDIHITKNDIDPDIENVQFTFNERTYKMRVDSMLSVQSADGGIVYRPTILLDIKIKNQVIPKVVVNLNDRSKMEYQFLIGMNLLSKCDLVIDPSLTEDIKQKIHEIINEQYSATTSNKIEVASEKKDAIKSIMEIMTTHPSITFNDLFSTIKLDTIDICSKLQN